MKRILLFALIAVGCLGSSCNKKDNAPTPSPLPEDKGCINRTILKVTDHAVSGPDLSTVESLFKSAKINYNNFRFLFYFHDSASMDNPPYTRFDDKTVTLAQYANGLPIFNSNMSFNFRNDSFNVMSGTLSKGTSLNTTPLLKLSQVRKLFVDDLKRYEFDSSQINSCMRAEFGYYNIGYGSPDKKEQLIKAWRVTLKETDAPVVLPEGLYQDEDGKLIYFDNGMRTNTIND